MHRTIFYVVWRAFNIHIYLLKFYYLDFEQTFVETKTCLYICALKVTYHTFII